MPDEKQYRIMVVEDEFIVAEDIVGNLRRMGFDVLAAVSSGEAAIQAAIDQRPDLIVMDIKLSGEMDGIEAAQQIKEHFDLPVI